MKAPLPRILLVEDHEDTRDLVALILADSNYLVKTAETLAAAMKLAETENFSLFILDSDLPDGSGLELCERIRKTDQRTPIVFYSGLAYERDKTTALAAGAQAYLVKPVSVDELVRSAAQLIASAARPGVVETKRNEICLKPKPLVAANRI
jgi:DNA-binding response OmpR family regulator